MTSRAPVVEALRLRGPAGLIQGRKECPADREPRGVALVCHPHPLHGGTMDNKVVYTLARSFLTLGCAVIRFNYRGVGASEGSYGDGIGEAEDADAVATWIQQQWPDIPLFLGGFSFGAMVVLTANQDLSPDGLVTVAPPVAHLPADISQPGCPWLVMQGNEDEIVDADAVIDWLNSLEPGPELRVMSGADHFLHGRLIELGDNVIEFFKPQLSVEP